MQPFDEEVEGTINLTEVVSIFLNTWCLKSLSTLLGWLLPWLTSWPRPQTRQTLYGRGLPSDQALGRPPPSLAFLARSRAWISFVTSLGLGVVGFVSLGGELRLRKTMSTNELLEDSPPGGELRRRVRALGSSPLRRPGMVASTLLRTYGLNWLTARSPPLSNPHVRGISIHCYKCWPKNILV